MGKIDYKYVVNLTGNNAATTAILYPQFSILNPQFSSSWVQVCQNTLLSGDWCLSSVKLHLIHTILTIHIVQIPEVMKVPLFCNQ